MDPRTSKNNAAHMMLEVERRGFVGTVSGVDLSAALASADVDRLHRWWAQYPVLIFRDQQFDHQGLVRAAQVFGEFGTEAFLKPSSLDPHVVEVRREPNERVPVFGANWHSDWSFQPVPPSATLLHGKLIPPTGGDTLFADGYSAYDTLDDELKNSIAGLSAVHSARRAYGPDGLFARDDDTRSMAIVVSAEAERTQCHPLVRQHPETGRKSLFINPVYTVGIDGMPALKAQQLLNRLFTQMTQPRFVYRHRWCAQTLVMWDNRSVIHYAEGGYDGHRRLMHRTTLAGEAPLAASA